MQFNDSRVIMSDYTKRKKKRGQKTKTNIDLARQVRVDIKPEWMKNMRVVRDLTYHQRRDIRGNARDVTYSGFKIVSRDLQGLDGFQYIVGERYKRQTTFVVVSLRFSFFTGSTTMFGLRGTSWILKTLSTIESLCLIHV